MTAEEDHDMICVSDFCVDGHGGVLCCWDYMFGGEGGRFYRFFFLGRERWYFDDDGSDACGWAEKVQQGADGG